VCNGRYVAGHVVWQTPSLTRFWCYNIACNCLHRAWLAVAPFSPWWRPVSNSHLQAALISKCMLQREQPQRRKGVHTVVLTAHKTQSFLYSRHCSPDAQQHRATRSQSESHHSHTSRCGCTDKCTKASLASWRWRLGLQYPCGWCNNQLQQDMRGSVCCCSLRS
jgi:hypothetical protein